MKLKQVLHLRVALIVSILINLLLLFWASFWIGRSNDHAKQRNDLYQFVILHGNGYDWDEFTTLLKKIDGRGK